MSCDGVTDSEILDALRRALFDFSRSGKQSYTVAGRSITFATLKEIQDLIELYESRVAAASSQTIGGGGVLIGKHDCQRATYGFQP